jgi:PPK2 family polyphosphate:nucleotide phosphotransferase
LKDLDLDAFLVEPGKKISLAEDFDPDYKVAATKAQAQLWLEQARAQLANYQERLYAENTRGVLMIFQAMDAAGKDGTIKHVMSGINPMGCQVFSFKSPSAEELDHDFLWRCFRALPERGRLGIFNRSYYEDVLIVRVHPHILEGQQLPPQLKGKGIWKRRFEHIRQFEKYLVENGIEVIKFFLNVSKAEQKKRFLARIDQPEKNWKFSPADVRERAHWDDYQRAYEEALSHTSTRYAPWYVVPADHKWMTHVSVMSVLLARFKEMDPRFPDVDDRARERLAEARLLLESED